MYLKLFLFSRKSPRVYCFPRLELTTHAQKLIQPCYKKAGMLVELKIDLDS